MNIERRRAFVAGIEKTYGSRLRRYLSARMRHASADVPDLAQEVFLRLLRVKDHEAIRNPQAYLYTVARHVLHQYALQRSLSPETMEFLSIAAELEAFAEDPAADAETEQRFEELGRGLQQFSPRAYATLLLYRCEGMTLEEIGSRFGVTRVMAKKYLTKALIYCQQRLEDQE